jgi:hypothetical protein
VTKWLVYALSLLVYACGAPEDPHAQALHDKGGGKLPAELAPYDPEPDAEALVTPDAGGAMPDAGQAAPDSAAEAPGDAQAPRADAAVPAVDAGALEPLGGSWRVTLAPVGVACQPPLPSSVAVRLLEGSEGWTVDVDQLGTLYGAPAALRGRLQSGRWETVASVHVAGAELAGALERSDGSCADRWTIRGVRP